MLRGAVLPQWVRHPGPGGGAGCRCRRGRPHGPYFYLFEWMPGRRQRKRYVRIGEVEEVRALCRQYRRMQTRCREDRRRSEALLRQTGHLCRVLEQEQARRGKP